MKWFARDDRHSSEVFRVFSVKFQLSPNPAETPTAQVRHITEQIHFAVFSNLFFERRSYRNHVLFCELPRNAEGDRELERMRRFAAANTPGQYDDRLKPRARAF